MINYTPFWNTLKKSKESTYTLIHQHGISPTTIQRLRTNQGVNTNTINDLCKILHCDIPDIIAYIPEEEN